MHYIVFYIYFLLLAFLDLVRLDLKVKNLFFFLSISGLIIISTIRWETGADWENYLFLFQDAEEYWKGNFAQSNPIEPGYTWLNYIVSVITNEYTAMLLLNALLAIGLKSIFFAKETTIMFIVLFFYYCYYVADIAMVRQFVASSFTVLAIYLAYKKQRTLFVLSVLVGATIHYSALVFLLAYYIFWLKTSKRFLYVILMLSFVLGFLNFAGYVIDFVLAFVPGGSFVKTKLMGYQDDGLESASGNPYVFFLLGAAKRMVVMPLFIWRISYIDSENYKKYNGFLNLVLFGNLIYFIFILSLPAMQRLSVYFSFYEIFLWGYFIMSFRDINLRITVFVFAALFGAVRLYLHIRPYIDYYVPYRTIFDF